MPIKTKLILYLSGLGIFLAIKDRDPVFLFALCLSVVTAAAVEAAVFYFKTKAFRVTESSLITGLIIGCVLSADKGWRNIIIACFLAILSKHVIRFQKRHIFNPAAFGILIATVVFGASTQWKGTYMWYVLVPFGIYFTRGINKTELIAGYLAVSFLLFGGQALMHKVPLLNVLGYFSWFYVFVMLIEPKTTPMRKTGKYIFGALVAGLIFILTSLGVRFDVELFSLLAANCIAPFLNKLS